MTERQKLIIQLALIALRENVQDINDRFEYDGPDCQSGNVIIVDGNIIPRITEDEVTELAKLNWAELKGN